ncbi:hypothetical protein NBRC116592_20140 [Colwellia sp. KU-HH00111]
MSSILFKKKLSSNQKQFFLAVVLGVVGALVNFFPVSLAFNISLVLGNAAYIIAASLLRPSFTFVCALITVIPLYFYWGHPNGFITFGLEALFISILRARGWYVLSAGLLYWLIIGMPLTAILVLIHLDYAQGYVLFTIFKQGINAVLYTSFACIIMFTLDFYVQNKGFYQPKLNKSLPKWLFYYFWSISVFIAVGASLFLSTRFVDLQRSNIKNELNISNAYIASIGNSYINEHRIAIQSLADQISFTQHPESNDEILSRLHSLYPGFITMFIASEHGIIKQASPKSMLPNLKLNQYSVKDRPYFINTMNKKQLNVSPIFQGRGFGNAPIVAISAPIYAKNNTSKPVGIVEGSLNVGEFGFYHKKGHDNSDIKIIVTDNNDSIIYGSQVFGFDTLTKLDYQVDLLHQEHSLITLNTPNTGKKNYLYKEKELESGWKIYSLIEHDVLLNITERLYLLIFLALFIILFLAGFLAKLFAHTINRPLAFVMRELSKDDTRPYPTTIPYDTPIEIEELYQELKISRQAILSHQVELENKVREQTDKLTQANNSLENLANTDTLTGLNNRRYFEKNFSLIQAVLTRNNSKMMFIILDIDHFKVINDKYGHLFGDYCLKTLGQIISSLFKRDSDVVARFGGEEFVIVSQCSSFDEAKVRCEELRNKIENFCFKCDLDNTFKLTASIGVAFGNASYAKELEAWLSIADVCLYHVKEHGRNSTEIKTVN